MNYDRIKESKPTEHPKIKQVELVVTGFQTSDGSVYERMDKAVAMQKVEDGLARLCPRCNGKKTFIDKGIDGRESWAGKPQACTRCDQYGLQYPKTSWEKNEY